jgi:hypothetical protein
MFIVALSPTRSGGVPFGCGKDERKLRVRDKNESQLCEPAHGTPPERGVCRAAGYKHRTPPE